MPEEDKKIHFWEVIAIGIGGTIGPSMFVILGFATRMAHELTFISLIIAGVIALLIGLNYAELATTFPEMGGGYFYTKEAFGGFVAYFTGISLWIGYITYGAVCALGFSYLLSVIYPVNPLALSSLLILLFLLLNTRGLKESAKIQLIFVTILLGTFILIIVSGFMHAGGISVRSESNIGVIGGVFKAAAFLSIAYFGFEPIGVLAGGVEKPEKTIPIGIIISVTSCIIVYSLIALVSTMLVDWRVLSRSATPLVIVAVKSLGQTGVIITCVAGMMATLTSLNVSLSSAAHVFHAMAHDYYFPEKFTYTHPKYGTPIYCLLVSSLFMELFVLSGMIEYITHVADFGVLISLSIINISTVTLRAKRQEVRRPFKVPLFPWLPISSSILTFVLAFILEPQAILLWFGMLLSVSIIYLINHITPEKRKYTLSGFLFAVGVLLGMMHGQFGFDSHVESLRILAVISNTLLILEVISCIFAAFLILVPLHIFILSVRRVERDILYVTPTHLKRLSEAVDDFFGCQLIVFGLVNLLIFYGMLHEVIYIVAPTKIDEAVFEIFISILLVISGLFECIVGIFFIKRKYEITLKRETNNKQK